MTTKREFYMIVEQDEDGMFSGCLCSFILLS